MLPTSEVPVIVPCCTRSMSLGWFFSHIFLWQQLIMRMQLPSFQWCSCKIRVMQWWSRFSLRLSWCLWEAALRSYRSLLSLLVPGCWRRPGSSCRRRSCVFRASSWMRRRNGSTRKRWSGGCRNAWCSSPRWAWKSTCPYFFLPGAVLPISSLFTSITGATKLFWGLCTMGAVGDMKPVFRASLEWKYQCLLKLCSCSPSWARAVLRKCDFVWALASMWGQRTESCCCWSVLSHWREFIMALAALPPFLKRTKWQHLVNCSCGKTIYRE